MKAKKFGNKFVLRIDRGEEIASEIKKFCEKEEIFSGSVMGIGAVKGFTVRFFDPAAKEYRPKEFSGVFEITSLVGNAATLGNEVYLHLHITLSDENFNCFGGHLEKAIVGATCEVVIEKFSGKLERKFSGEIGLNLLNL